MATLCIIPDNTHLSSKSEKDIVTINSNSCALAANINTSGSSSASTSSSSSEPPKVSKFFSNSSNYQSKIQQLISFSFTSSNFIFITFILSISKLCTTAAADPAQAGAAHQPAPSAGAPPGFLMNNFSSSAILEKLNSFRTSTLGPPTNAVKGKDAGPTVLRSNKTNRGSLNVTSTPSSSSSKSSSASSTTSSPLDLNFNSSESSSLLNIFGSNGGIIDGGSPSILFLNISGKVGTPLGI
ncbi:uncharacterized protein LOC133323532, partial [Musca vetustissima]|uniref:uncharacterized protein LOC133323532 n=1 Tax=Musca vetustissima TaxID=27455 RepID=UPI002AB66513